METEIPEAALIRQFEERLLHRNAETPRDDIASLLADDFVEFGSSGRVWGKADVVDDPPPKTQIQKSISDFRARKVSPDVVLVTYRVARRADSDADASHTLRSSIWKMIDGRWQMIFHQGTPSADR